MRPGATAGAPSLQEPVPSLTAAPCCPRVLTRDSWWGGVHTSGAVLPISPRPRGCSLALRLLSWQGRCSVGRRRSGSDWRCAPSAH